MRISPEVKHQRWILVQFHEQFSSLFFDNGPYFVIFCTIIAEPKTEPSVPDDHPFSFYLSRQRKVQNRGPLRSFRLTAPLITSVLLIKAPTEAAPANPRSWRLSASSFRKTSSGWFQPHRRAPIRGPVPIGSSPLSAGVLSPPESHFRLLSDLKTAPPLAVSHFLSQKRGKKLAGYPCNLNTRRPIKEDRNTQSEARCKARTSAPDFTPNFPRSERRTRPEKLGLTFLL